jgi:hypothetical protein
VPFARKFCRFVPESFAALHRRGLVDTSLMAHCSRPSSRRTVCHVARHAGSRKI